MRRKLLLLVSFFPLVMDASDVMSRDKIQKRIQPIGSVRVQALGSLTADKAHEKEVVQNKGKDIYEHFCITCHQDGVAGAPKFHDEKDWKPRLTGKKVDDLVASAIKGLNAMPSQGTCTTCSNEDLKAAIDYMIPKL